MKSAALLRVDFLCQAASRAVGTQDPQTEYNRVVHPEKIPMLQELSAQLAKSSTGKTGNRLLSSRS